MLGDHRGTLLSSGYEIRQVVGSNPTRPTFAQVDRLRQRSPALLEKKVGLRFRKAVTEFAADNDIPVIRFAKGERKLEVMRPYLEPVERAPPAATVGRPSGLQPRPAPETKTRNGGEAHQGRPDRPTCEPTE